jgi:hypothetical protein
MGYQIDGNDIGIFVNIDTYFIFPLEPSSFSINDTVDIEFIENDEFAILTNLDGNTTNPYTEIWCIEKIPVPKNEKVEIKVKKSSGSWFDPLDLAIWFTVLIVSSWMLYISTKILIYG